MRTTRRRPCFKLTLVPEYHPGSAGDFDRLYRDFRTRLLQTVLVVVRDATEAEDCVQEAFERAFLAWPRFRPEGPVLGWLRRIAINVAVSYQRRQSLAPSVEPVLGTDLGRMTFEPESVIDTLDLVAALKSLTTRQSGTLVLRHVYGYSNREIGKALGIPERTVASRLAMARVLMAAQLNDQPRRRAAKAVPVSPPAAPPGIRPRRRQRPWRPWEDD